MQFSWPSPSGAYVHVGSDHLFYDLLDDFSKVYDRNNKSGGAFWVELKLKKISIKHFR